MKKLLLGLATLALLVLLGLSFLLFSESGLALALSTVGRLGAGVEVAAASGTLGKSFSLQGLRFSSAQVEIEMDHLDFAWKPLELWRGVLHIGNFDLDGLRVALAPADLAESDGQLEDFSLPEYGLPLEVDIDRLEVTSVRLQSGDAGVVRVDRLELQVTAQNRLLRLNNLELASDQVDLELAGSLGLSSGWPLVVAGSWKARPPGGEELAGELKAGGKLADGQLTVTAHSPVQARLHTTFSLTEGVRFSSNLQAEAVDPALFFAVPPARFDIDMEVSGTVAEDGLRGDFNIAEIAGEIAGLPVEASGTGAFSGTELSFQEMRLRSRGAGLRLQGRLGERLEADFAGEAPDLGRFIAGAGGRVRINGTVSGAPGDPGVNLELEAASLSYGSAAVAEVNLTAQAAGVSTGEIEVRASGSDAVVGDQVIDKITAELHGTPARQRLQLELAGPLGSLVLAGSGGLAEQAWNGTLNRLRLSPQGLAGSFELEGETGIEAAVEGIAVEPLCLVRAQTRVCLQGSFAEGAWQASAEVEDFDPGLVAAKWPGSLSASLSTSGSVAAGEVQGRMELRALQGRLRTFPVDGRALIAFDGDQVALETLTLQSAGATLQASGSLDGQGPRLRFTGAVADFGDLLPGWAGRLEASGTLAGTGAAPFVEARIEAREVAGEGFALQSADADVALDLSSAGATVAEIRVAGLQGAGQRLRRGTLKVDGTTVAHVFEADLETDMGTLDIEGGGSYDGTWQGNIHTARFVSEHYGSWHLSGPSSLGLSPGGGEVRNFCPATEKARFCLSAGLEEMRRWHFETDIDVFALSLLQDLSLIETAVAGEVGGTLALRGDGAALLDAQGRLAAEKIELVAEEESGEPVPPLLDTRVEVAMQGEQVAVTLQSGVGREGELDAALRLAPSGAGSAGIAGIPLDGRVSFDLPDLSLVSSLTDAYLQPSGTLRGSLTIAGELGRPEIDGQVQLTGGSVLLSSLGITLEDVAATLWSGGEEVEYELTARSAEGRARARGIFTIGGDSGWQLTSHLTGSDFRLLATEEYLIDTSPDVDLRLGSGSNYIKGSLSIPHARVDLGESEARVEPSSDVVIVDHGGARAGSRGGLSIDLDVTLGDDVRIDAYGLKSALTGSLDLKNSPGRLLTAFGELVVSNGRFSFYSAELEVTRGRLLFSGGPITNPGVDFRARRRVEDKVVGVEVGGTAEELDIRFFSDPMMEESNILAYLLVGRSLYASSENEQSLIGAAAEAVGLRGINTVTSSLQKYLPLDEIYLDGSTTGEDISVVMGKYLTEDLFVGYDHNFFDSSGEFKIRYNLGGNFSVETTTSVDSTSGDILYTIEK